MQTPKKTVTVRDSLRNKTALAIEPAPPVATDQAAVEEGRKPLAARGADAAAQQAKAAGLYGIPAAGLAPIPSLDGLFKFAPADSDAEFIHLHVESLFEQAAAILDRCRAVRAQRDMLHLEKWNHQIELDRFFRLNQLADRERQAGRDTLAYERSLIEASACASLEENYRGAEAHLKTLLDDLIATGFNKRMSAKELYAWLLSYPLKDAELTGDDAAYTFDGAKKTKPEHLFEAARMEADEAAWEQFHSLMSSRFSAMAESEAARFRKQSLDLQARWAVADIAFQGEKARVAQDAVWEKMRQAQAPGGILNYQERIAPLERRFFRDFREALARLVAARRGLQELYDYAPALPQEGTAGYFDEIAEWVAQTRDRLKQFTQLEQDYVLVLSLKDLTKSQWEAGRSASTWTFAMPEDLFKGQAHVRLRGLGLAVVGEKPDPSEAAQKLASAKPGATPKPEAPKPEGFWSARVSVPPTATVRYLSGKTFEIDQRALPACFLGRVADRDSRPEPEIARAGILHNASPIGRSWKVTLSAQSTDGFLTTNLHDVELYLNLAVRGLKGEG